MSLRNAVPLRFSPKGLSDSLDETDQFPGACASLQNLIPDPSTADIWTPRPASIKLTDFSGFSAPGAVSVFKVIGDHVLGLIASSTFPGKDQPFWYNLKTGVFSTPSNILATNLPSTQPTTGNWTPPTMDLVGIYLIVTHPGFDGVNNFIGWFDVYNLNINIVAWHGGNLLDNGALQPDTLAITTPGAGYVDGLYHQVPLTGGTGTGAINANMTVTGGVVTDMGQGAFGKNYIVGDVLSVNNANLGGVGAGFTATVIAIVAGQVQFTTVPSWVAQFNQRAHFGVNPTIGQPSDVFTDVLGLQCSNVNQVLTFGNNLPLVAAAGLGLSNQLGGIIQSLMVFQDQSNIQQVTGDYASTNIAINPLNVAVGTAAPRAIASTPEGLMFLAPDGIRLIDFDARVSDPIGAAGGGVVLPFINAFTPSRAVAECNGQVLRVSVRNGGKPGNPWEEYWYDLVRKVWSGPHTLPSTVLDTYEGAFILAPQSAPATLFSSAVNPSSSSTFTENGTPLSWTMQTVLLADNQEMAQSEIAELQVKAGFATSAATLAVAALDQDGNTLASTVYGGSLAGALAAHRIDFSAPVVYNRLALRLQAASALNQRIGDIFMRRRSLGYMQAVA